MRNITCILIVCATISAAGQQLTIPEMVAHSGGEPIATSRLLELQDFSLRELAETASLVVGGTVSAQRAYLSDDKRWVYTDYDVVPSRIYFAREPINRTTPGNAPITVRKFGGKLQINGVTVSVLDETIAQFEVGEHVIAFLIESADRGKFDLVFEAGGFAVRKGRMAPLVKSPRVLSNVRDMHPARFSETVAQEIARRRKAQ
jgi:hypothetical protein